MVFKYLKKISTIPRGSGNEKGISNYLVKFANEHNLQVIQDESLNIIIRKEATKGYENVPTVILQGHMDMVCEKNQDVHHDFEKDPIDLVVEGDFIKGNGTTLGADNGLGIAYCLAILESEDIEHPPLEVLITTKEEIGMQGAFNIDEKNLSGKILINIDSEEEGELLTSCAGGIRNKVRLTVELENKKEEFSPYKISVKGLKGGHSGVDIKKGRANSNKLIGRVLNDITSKIELFISEINGGSKMNAIPREAEAIIFIKDKKEDELVNIVRQWNKIFKNEFRVSDRKINLKVDKIENKFYRVFSKALTDKIIALLMLIPQGIETMSSDIEGLVQSSTNLGVVTTTEDEVTFESAIRSSVKSLKTDIVKKIQVLCKHTGAAMTLESDYPAWEYKENSYIRDVFIKVYKEMYGDEPKVTAVHAGLECGILKEILGDIDMISFGPNIYDAHTPDERFSISSSDKTYKYLINVLKEICVNNK